ncbi:hypothetical protein ACTZWT_09740 [Rhodopseudomonas sp. NSM]|uniref:hypothetical protein n=1 Tax=Rhodopseudomonas sp. NSM TaxID=3457630 RepID=UPI0040359E76
MNEQSRPRESTPQEPSDRERMETELATRLPPLLFTVAVFSLSILSNLESQNTTVDEFLAIFAALCLISAALLVDSLLDKLKLTFNDRFFLLHGGYLLFSASVSSAIPLLAVLYLYGSDFLSASSAENSTNLTITFAVFGATAASMFWKMMTLDIRNISFMALLTSAFASIAWLYHLRLICVAGGATS